MAAALGMAANATVQHNLLALQAQVQALQVENAALTKDLCLKDNYLQLKEQQVRAMHKRLEELEAAIATWKDKYLEQLHAAPPAANTTTEATSGPLHDREWLVYAPSAHETGATPPRPEVVASLLEKLSSRDREKLKTLLFARDTVSAADGSDSGATSDNKRHWEETFEDVSDELRQVLLRYLLPVLLESQQHQPPGGDGQTMTRRVHYCYSRTYMRPAVDFKIIYELHPTTVATTANAPGGASGSANPGRTSRGEALTLEELTEGGTSPQSILSQDAMTLTPSSAPAPTSQSAQPRHSLSGAATRGSLESLSSAPPSSLPAAVPPPTASVLASSTASSTASSAVPSLEEHLFDCVDCDAAARRNPPVPHGPREIHPTKAVYISRPLPQTTPPPAPTSTTSSASSTSGSTLRRYSLAPTKSGSSAHAEASRTMTMAAGSVSVPSSASGPSSFTGGRGGDRVSFPDLAEGGSGDRRSGSGSGSLTGSAPKDPGKIKKIMGSVMKGLHRHKPQLTTTHPQLEEDDSICDGCGRGPLTGVKWVCRTCRLVKEQEYELCEKCYGQGLHGKENEDALFERIEEIVVTKCPKLLREQELMRLLRVGICKANLKKYSFCLTWIADLILCKQTRDLRARALEISQITPQVRSEFVRLLKELLHKYRRDIELLTEWHPVQNAAVAPVDHGLGVAPQQLDTLRIWVKDYVDASNSNSAGGGGSSSTST